MRLPVNVLFHPQNETPASLACRLARAMAYPSVIDLTGKTTLSAIARGEEPAIELLSSWSGVESALLRRFAVPVSEEAGEWRLGGAVFRKEMRVGARFRYCPHCLIEDVEVGTGRPEARPYERACWITRAVTSCTRHRTLLVEADDNAPMFDVALLAAQASHLLKLSRDEADPHEIEVDQYIEGRICGERGQSFIDRQEVHVLQMLFKFLGSLAIRSHPSFRDCNDPVLHSGVRAVGFKIAREGREAIEEAIIEAVARQKPTADAISKFLGPTLRHLRRNANSSAYAEVIEVLQSVVERSVPLGPGDRVVHVVQTRKMHSVGSAAKEFGLNPKRVWRILESQGSIKRAELTDERVYIPVADAEAALSGLSEYLTTVEVGEAIGLHEDKVRELVRRNLLPATECGTTEGRPYFRFDRMTVDRFRRELFSGLKLVAQDEHLVTLNNASKRRSLTQLDLIEMIVSGVLRQVACTDNSWKVSSLLINLKELPDEEAVFSTLNNGCDLAELRSLREVERALSTTTATVSALLKNGYLLAELRTNPRSRRKQPYVHRDSIDTFRANYMSLRQISLGWRKQIAIMRDELEQHGLYPIFDTTGHIARYYIIAELTDNGFLPPMA